MTYRVVGTRCAADRNCGWCEVKGCLANKDANKAACEALRRAEDHGEASDPSAALWLEGGAHTPRCNRGETCSECIAIPGCGWCHGASQCISGAAPQRSKFLGFLEEVRGADRTCAEPGDSDTEDIEFVENLGWVADDECNALPPLGSWKKCLSGCVPRQNSCPAGSLVTWFKRGAPHYFDMLTGKRNVRCELCGFDVDSIDSSARYPESTGETRGALNATGHPVDVNTGNIGGVHAWCSGRGVCQGATPEICYDDEPSRPCPLVPPAACSCEPGFRGVGCELACPLGPDCAAPVNDCAYLLPIGAWKFCAEAGGCVPRARSTVCSGRGRCEEDATCLCHAGYAGAACELESGCAPSAENMCLFRNTTAEQLAAADGNCTMLSPAGAWRLCGNDCVLAENAVIQCGRSLLNGDCTCGQGPGAAPSSSNGGLGRRQLKSGVLPAFSLDVSEYRCKEGWFGPACEFPCPGIDALTGEGEICNGMGECTATVETMVAESCETRVPVVHRKYAESVSVCGGVNLGGYDISAKRAACEAHQTTAIDPTGSNMCLYTASAGVCVCDPCTTADEYGVCQPDTPPECGDGQAVCTAQDDGSYALQCECPGAEGPTAYVAPVPEVAERCSTLQRPSASSYLADVNTCNSIDISSNSASRDRAACESPQMESCLETARGTPASNSDDAAACLGVALGSPTSQANCLAVTTAADGITRACTYGSNMCMYTPRTPAVKEVQASGCGTCNCQNGGKCNPITKECECGVESCVEAAAVSVSADAAACAGVVLGVDKSVIPAACTGTAYTVYASCTGTALQVGETCTGTASGADTGKVCDLDAVTDGTDACPEGCVSTAAYVPECDLRADTDGTDICPAGCTEVLTHTPVCDFDAATDEMEICPAGCTETPQTTLGSRADCGRVMTAADPDVPACIYSPAYVGDSCEHECNREGACNNGGACNFNLKMCTCDWGWLGRWCDLQLLQGVIDCDLPRDDEYVTTVWDPAMGKCAEFTTCSNPVCDHGGRYRHIHYEEHFPWNPHPPQVYARGDTHGDCSSFVPGDASTCPLGCDFTPQIKEVRYVAPQPALPAVPARAATCTGSCTDAGICAAGAPESCTVDPCSGYVQGTTGVASTTCPAGCTLAGDGPTETCTPTVTDCSTGYVPGTRTFPSRNCPAGCVLTHSSCPRGCSDDGVSCTGTLLCELGAGGLAADCDTAAGCTYTGADDGVTLCDLDGTTDNTNRCVDGCVYTPEVLYTPPTAEVEEVEYVPFRAEFCVPTDGSRVARSTSRDEIAEIERGVPAFEDHCEYVVAACVQGDMNTLGSDTEFETCSQPQTPDEYVVFQAPGEWVTDRCVPGDMHTLGVDTVFEDCQIRETPMQETRLREHGTGKDGPIYVGPRATAKLNQDRYSTHSNFEAASYLLRLLTGQGAFESGQMALVHQTLVGETSDYEVGTWEFAVVHSMTAEADCSVGGPTCTGVAADGLSICDLLEVTDGTADCPDGCTWREDPCSFLAPAGRWQQAFDSVGEVIRNAQGRVECVPNQLVSYLRVAQPLTNAYSTGVELGDYAQVVRVDEVTSVKVMDGGKLTVDGWNGRHGGIMAFLATGILDVQPGGQITTMGTGYRGVPRQSVNLQIGDQGEGLFGFGDQSVAAMNIAGGGGDKDQLVSGQYCSFGGGGGGGGHATPGADGFPGGLPAESTGTFEERMAAVNGQFCAVGGAGGGTILGNENQTKLYFGGAGGQGGADDDGYGSAGGNGGGKTRQAHFPFPIHFLINLISRCDAGVLVAAVTGVDVKCACVETAARSVAADASACAAVPTPSPYICKLTNYHVVALSQSVRIPV